MAFTTRKQTKNLPHVIINAGPGVGKTSTMIAGLSILSGRKIDWEGTDEQKTIWKAMKGHYSTIGFQAFNKSIADEIQEKVPPHVKASTFHSFGLKVLRDNDFKLKISGQNVRFTVKDIQGYGFKERQSADDFKTGLCVSKVVSLLKNNLLDPTIENVGRVVDEYNINVPRKTSILTLSEFSEMTMDKSLEVKSGSPVNIDFDDMLWLPIKLGLDFTDSKFDLLICDESQDLNPIQHKLVTLSGSRLVCVGDRRQSIYGFRGADSKSMDTLKEVLEQTDRGVVELNLNTTFRLPKSGVENVKGYAPNLVAAESAIDGEIKQTVVSQMEPKAGDLVLSRINANIFTSAFRLLRKRVPVRIQGKDFGTQIKKLLESECEGCDGSKEIALKLASYHDTQRDSIMQRTFPTKALFELDEKMACLYSLTSGCNTLEEMSSTLEELFSEEAPRSSVVLLSTIHRAKGMEADTVWFLEPQLCPHPMAETEFEIAQEMNIKFVAETRHKKELIYVYPDSNPGDIDREYFEGRMAEQEEPTLTDSDRYES